jgi:hypothetical protein
MANTASPEWLKEELTKALGWDAMFMEGVVQAICDASSKAEMQHHGHNILNLLHEQLSGCAADCAAELHG